VFQLAQGAMNYRAGHGSAPSDSGLAGHRKQASGNVIAFAPSAVLMFILAWLIERAGAAPLVNQEGVTR
jgi:hypothetical protein